MSSCSKTFVAFSELPCPRNHSTDTTCAIHEESLQNYQKSVLDKQSKTAFNSERYCGNINLKTDDFEKYLQLPSRDEFRDCNTGTISKDDIDALFKTDIQNVQSNKRSFSDTTSSNEQSIKRLVFRQSNVGSNGLAPSRTSKDFDRPESNVNDRLFDSCHSNQIGRKSIFEADINRPHDRTAKYPVLPPQNMHQQNEQNITPPSWTTKPNEPETARDRNSFITARELHRQNLIKNGQNLNQPSTSTKPSLFAYGKSTKTLGLGVRRSVHSKFVPPATMSSSSNAQPIESCTNDTDIDPRLKSIEPKMIELIENEIMHQTSAVGKIFRRFFFLFLKLERLLSLLERSGLLETSI